MSDFMAGVPMGQSHRQLVELLARALDALYSSARKTLGDVTLAAIVDRVFYTAAERHAFLSRLTLLGSTVSCAALLDDPEPPDEQVTRAGLQFVLAEFLTVLGNLTAEILTPAFQGELAKLVETPAVAPGQKDTHDKT
jgi:hypothetical protein